MDNAKGFAVSVPGNGHIRHEIPCQDASGVWFTPRPLAIVCDGRGSAKFAHLGAQAGVRAFRSQCAVLEPMLAAILDNRRKKKGLRKEFCKMIIRTLAQQKQELAGEHDCGESEFDFTVSFAVCGKQYIGCFQIGDGAITIRKDGNFSLVFMPDKGEFDNQTRFLRSGDDLGNAWHKRLIDASNLSGIAITSDGPEFLMYELPAMVPGPIFPKLFADLEAGTLTRQDILDYLTASRWSKDPRGSDDRSLAIISP